MGSRLWESQPCASSCLRRLSRGGYRDRRGFPSRPGAPSPALTSLAGRGSWLFTHVARRLEYVSARMLTEYQWHVQIASPYVSGACPHCWTACVHVVASTQSRLFANDWYRRVLAGLAIRCARSLRHTAHTMLVDVYRQRGRSCVNGARGDGVFETDLQTRAVEWRFIVCERSVCGSKYRRCRSCLVRSLTKRSLTKGDGVVKSAEALCFLAVTLLS